MATAEQSFYHYFLYRFLLTDDEIEFFEIDDPMVLHFIYCKRNIAKLIENYQIDIISLGSNCFSKTISVMFGFTEFALPRLPFDNLIIPMAQLIDILVSRFVYFFADDIAIDSENRKYYTNKSKNLYFIHDHIFNNKPKEENLLYFNSELKERINKFYVLSQNNRRLFLLSIFQSSNDEIKKLYELQNILNKEFNTINLFVLNFSENKIPPDFEHVDIPLPRCYRKDADKIIPDSYQWHKITYYLSYEGISFFLYTAESIANFILKNIPYKSANKNFTIRSPQFYKSGILYLNSKGANKKKIEILNEKLKNPFLKIG